MAATVSKGLKDCTHLKVVPVIATYDGNGNILPLYVRIGEESFKIYNAYVSESTYRILTFKGEVMVQDAVRPIKLSYFMNDLIWCIPKNQSPKSTSGPGDQKFFCIKKGLTSYGKPNLKHSIFSCSSQTLLTRASFTCGLMTKGQDPCRGQVCHDRKSTTRFSCKEVCVIHSQQFLLLSQISFPNLQANFPHQL